MVIERGECEIVYEPLRSISLPDSSSCALSAEEGELVCSTRKATKKEERVARFQRLRGGE